MLRKNIFELIPNILKMHELISSPQLFIFTKKILMNLLKDI